MSASSLAQLIAAVEAGPPSCWAALRSLDELAEPDAHAFLSALFAHADAEVRRTAVIGLGANPKSRVAAALLPSLLHDDDRLVRHHAGIAFHRLRARPWTPSELDALVQTALVCHREARNDASQDEDVVALVTLHDLGRDVPPKDAAAADHVVDVGLALLRSADPVVRVFAVRLVRELHRRDEVAAALLAALRQERDLEVVSWCVGGLGFRATPAAVEVLASYVTHPAVPLRCRLASALSACALPRMSDAARDALLVLADDAHDDVRYAALFELSSWWQHEGLRDPRVRARLTRGLVDGDEGVRGTCEEALEAETTGR